ncbi:uncharacterized protein LOC125687934 [Lagopus muta]|uniref:uncharacterized protein LOC125687934 n=1 Tax=Lagopus muta TaxID=64668 RepID=UPI0020A132C1|nr:uncharacterized protein LOC125687934 [Lagopus muta]
MKRWTRCFINSWVRSLGHFPLVLVGDFNFPDICWNYNRADREQSRRFLKCAGDNFLTQPVRELMRGRNILDLLFVNGKGLVGDVKIGGRLGHSDHEILDFSILVEPQRGVSRTATLDFWRADFKLFRTMVERVPWVALESMGAQEGWEYFKEIVLKVQDLTIPMSQKMGRRARRPGWLNRDIWLELKNKREAYGLWKSGQAVYEDYRTCFLRPNMVFRVVPWSTAYVSSHPVVASTMEALWSARRYKSMQVHLIPLLHLLFAVCTSPSVLQSVNWTALLTPALW